MKLFLLSLAGLFACLSHSFVHSAHAYYGRHSSEAILDFTTQADLALGFVPETETLRVRGRVQTIVLNKLDEQIQHLMGTFQSESFLQEFKHAGVLGESYNVTFLSAEPSPTGEQGRALIRYHFRGRVVFHKAAFRSNPVREIPIKLPLSPDKIYDPACTDHHYNTFDDFWYFWDPDQRGCGLASNDTDVLRFKGRLSMLPNTELTYPHYPKLFGDNFNGEYFDIHAFFGYIGDVNSLVDPPRRDDARKAMRFLESDLKARGFTLTKKKDAFRIYSDGREYPGVNFIRLYEKEVRPLGLGAQRPMKVRVLAMLADTDIASRDGTFHRYFVSAMKNADVVLYDGHSGLGGTLDLKLLPRFKFNPDKYQVFFFNGCSSYPYFNGSFFRKKGGSRNLEVITAGLPTFSVNSGPNAVAFLDRFLDGKPRSYQTILSEIEASNGDWGSFLMGVSGDQDNFWKP